MNIHILERYLGQHKGHYPEYRFRCPFCSEYNGKSTHYLWVNIREKIFHCWLCGAGGKVSRLTGNFMHDISSSLWDAVDIDPVTNGCSIPSNGSFDVSQWQVYDPNSCDIFHKQIDFFLHSRGIFDATTILFISPEPRLKHRLIFPLYEKEIVAGYNARAIIANMGLRYVNPQNVEKDKLLYIPYAEPLLQQKCILTEGPMDALSIPGRLGISLTGSSISTAQVEFMSRNFKEVTVCLDGDKPGVIASIKTCKALWQHIPRLKITILDNGYDPNDYLKRGETYRLKYLIDNAAEFNPKVALLIQQLLTYIP